MLGPVSFKWDIPPMHKPTTCVCGNINIWQALWLKTSLTGTRLEAEALSQLHVQSTNLDHQETTVHSYAPFLAWFNLYCASQKPTGYRYLGTSKLFGVLLLFCRQMMKKCSWNPLGKRRTIKQMACSRRLHMDMSYLVGRSYRVSLFTLFAWFCFFFVPSFQLLRCIQGNTREVG